MSKGGAVPAASRGGGSAFQTGMSTFASCNKAGSIPHFNKHLANYPNDFNALWYRGQAHKIIGQSAEALRDFRQAERVSSGAEKEAVTAFLQGLQGNRTNRRQILQRAVQRYPDSGLLWQEYGSCMSYDNNSSEAKKAHQKVIALNYPFSYYSHYGMGQIYRSEGNKQEAVRQFEAAITKCPTLTIAHLNLGEVLEEEGKTQAASRYFERAKTLNPVLYEKWEKGRELQANLKKFIPAFTSLFQGEDDINTKLQTSSYQYLGRPVSSPFGASARESRPSASYRGPLNGSYGGRYASYLGGRTEGGRGAAGGWRGAAGGGRGGGGGGGRGGGGNSSGSDDDDRPWTFFDPESESDPRWNYKYNEQKIYKIGDYCYIRDRAGDRGHAGSYWKVYEYYPSKLVLSHAVNKYGERINKHESNKGHTIKKSDLVGYTRKRKS